MASYLPYEPQQQRLLPEAQDWLPEGHLAYFISDAVDSLDLNTFLRRWWTAPPTVSPGHDGQGVRVRLCHRRVQLAQDRQEAARGCGLQGAGRGQLPGAPHDQRLPRVPPEGARGQATTA